MITEPWVDPEEQSRQVRRAEARSAKKPFRLFKNFLARVWRFLRLPDPTPVQYDIADYLQFGPKRCVIQAFRGVGKSWITAAFVCWLLLMDPQKKIMVVSAGKDRSDAFSIFVKRLITEMPELQHLIPGKGQRSSNISFEVAPATPDQSPSLKSVGITGQLTGSRAHVIVADDIEVPKNSFTAPMREKIAELIKEFDAVLKPAEDCPADEPPRIIYLGTPQTEMSIYNRLPARGYEIRVWPARIPQAISKYEGRLAPFVMALIEGGAKAHAPVDRKRFTDIDLTERELSYGRSGFALQFMLDTSLADADRYPLKLEDLFVMGLDDERASVALAHGKDPRKNLLEDLHPVGFTGDFYYGPMWADDQFEPYSGSVLAIDPSGRGQDESGYCIAKQLHGRIFILAAGGLRGGATPTNLAKLAQLAKKHRVNAVTIEDNFGDGMWGQLFAPVLAGVWPCSVEGFKSKGQKELRILETLEPIVQQHRLVVSREVVEQDLRDMEEFGVNYSLFYQFTRITKERQSLAHDDRLEALQMAVSYWLDRIGVDEDKAAQAARDALLDIDLEAFIEDGGIGDQWAVARPNYHGA
ncbi:phage terminase large subunit [Phenylobacterium sp.]|uniref:phage terminase large subunit n=1 Tax=Phenylobacterium sp. TaxID=1871053 RepID=UPI002737C2B8|nr:phage terminase large subunit [Phenylobacterium sp.]MDP3869935.1 phage terminase large subunit [Phenylobacterium sp.]